MDCGGWGTLLLVVSTRHIVKAKRRKGQIHMAKLASGLATSSTCRLAHPHHISFCFEGLRPFPGSKCESL